VFATTLISDQANLVPSQPERSKAGGLDIGNSISMNVGELLNYYQQLQYKYNQFRRQIKILG